MASGSRPTAVSSMSKRLTRRYLHPGRAMVLPQLECLPSSSDSLLRLRGPISRPSRGDIVCNAEAGDIDPLPDFREDAKPGMSTRGDSLRRAWSRALPGVQGRGVVCCNRNASPISVSIPMLLGRRRCAWSVAIVVIVRPLGCMSMFTRLGLGRGDSRVSVTDGESG